MRTDLALGHAKRRFSGTGFLEVPTRVMAGRMTWEKRSSFRTLGEDHEVKATISWLSKTSQRVLLTCSLKSLQ